MIRLKDVEMEYPNGTRAIRGISAAIEDGEFVFLVGPSGSGKSTIIKMLTGEEVPTAGRTLGSHCEHVRKAANVPCILPHTGTQHSGIISMPIKALTKRDAPFQHGLHQDRLPLQYQHQVLWRHAMPMLRLHHFQG